MPATSYRIFNGDLGKETGKLAYSLRWFALDRPETRDSQFLTSKLGTGRVRDPFIGRDAEGKFVILATEGYDNPSIYVWKSDDPINLNEHGLHRVAWFDKGLYSTGSRAWAPEMTYDPGGRWSDVYLLFRCAGSPKAVRCLQ